jgi:methionyl-tRNA formyltransferase
VRLAFLGTPEAAVPTLRGLVAAGHDVAIVVTRADKRRGRGGAPAPSPVKAAALDLGLPVAYAPDEVVAADVALGVVVAYGRIIRAPLLDAVPLVNVHFSLLPRWRGAAPVERAILAGDTVTGVCVMGLEAGLDTGPVYRRGETPIGAEETADALRARLADLGRDLLVEALAAGLGTPQPQTGVATYAAKITPDELRIDWTRPGAEILRAVRVGRAWTTWKGKRLLVGAAAPAPGPPGAAPGVLDGDLATTGDGVVRLLVVQPEGRGAVEAAAWVRGARPGPDDRLGS